MTAKKYNIEEFEAIQAQSQDRFTARPPLYPRQKKVLNFIDSFIEKNGSSPTLTAIRDHLRVKTLSTVHWHLIQLEKKGYIYRDKESKGIDLILDTGKFAGAVISVKLIGLVTAGQPIDAFETKQDPIAVPEHLLGKKNHKDLFCLKVRGDSMIDAYVCDGDTIVCVETNGFANNGDMVVALLPQDNTATLKKYYKKKTHIVLQPANPEYEAIKVKNVKIQGKVVAIMRKL